MPDNKPLFICDPDRIFNATQLIRINNELAKVAIGTPCPCQRRSQCSSEAPTVNEPAQHSFSGGYSLNGNTFHGFIVSIALVDNLQMNFHSPSEQYLLSSAARDLKFSETRDSRPRLDPETRDRDPKNPRLFSSRDRDSRAALLLSLHQCFLSELGQNALRLPIHSLAPLLHGPTDFHLKAAHRPRGKLLQGIGGAVGVGRLRKFGNCVRVEALQKVRRAKKGAPCHLFPPLPQRMVIWPARLAERYITQSERKAILARVNDLVQNDKWSEAISQVIAEMFEELRGDPESRVDTGTLSLVIAVGVASLLTSLITGCVCAFRCCGNLSPSEEKSLSALMDSSSNFLPNSAFPPDLASSPQHLRHSRSPNSPNFGPRRSPTPPPQTTHLSFMAFSDTTVV